MTFVAPMRLDVCFLLVFKCRACFSCCCLLIMSVLCGDVGSVILCHICLQAGFHWVTLHTLIFPQAVTFFV